jgi:hypothetical protein
MGYDPNRSPSVVDNLALGIRGMGVEDDASLSQQSSPYRNGNHVPAGAPNALAHVHAAPLQPRGPYAAFPLPEYAPYYPGTPTGEGSHLSYTKLWVDLFQIIPCTPRHLSPQMPCQIMCIPR